jgi:rhomboid protease GluP
MFGLILFTGGTTALNLYKLGGMVTTPPTEGAEIWRWVSSIFLHGGGLHILMNSFSLYVFAPPLERLLKSKMYLFLYLGSGISGSAVSAYYSDQAVVSIGASGAVYGILGAYLAIILFSKYAMDAQSRQTIIVLLVVGMIGSLVMADVNGLAHFGGFIGGFLLYCLWYILRRLNRR